MKVKDYVPIAMGTLSESTRRGWSTYSARVVEVWGDRDLSKVLTSEIQAEANRVQEQATRRAVHASGSGAKEGFISCCRAIWKRAVNDGKCRRNPALAVEKPTRRTPAGRRPLNPEELGTVQGVLASAPDPDLNLIVFRLCLETGCRRNELLGIRVRDVQHSAYGWTVTLDNGAKNSSKRSLPISDELGNALNRLADERLGTVLGENRPEKADVRLIQGKRNKPITHRWLEERAKRVREFDPALGSSAEVYFTWHVLRHTAAALVERAGGFATAKTFLGHSTAGFSGNATTFRYTPASTEELRAVHTRIWNRREEWSPAARTGDDWAF